ncbi:MAG: nicotinate (nicotinamide) nucleotide adenylyltransferase [Armatimonadetes bacterium]|nr:nicotinate (nicotinamide) nucleotide adenylyltransferase [Armatimonadota bacterium]
MSETNLRKVGILGGTFDPPHLGHLAMAEAAAEQLGLDEVLFIPASQNPLKFRKSLTPAKERMEMVSLLIEGHPNFAVSDIEITRGEKSFAVDTLTELHFGIPAHYWFILGSDSLKTIYDWKQPDRLAKLTRFAAIIRPPDTRDDALRDVPDYIQEVVDFISMDPTKASSTEIRRAIAEGKSFEHWLSEPVANYIRKNRLYEL